MTPTSPSPPARSSASPRVLAALGCADRLPLRPGLPRARSGATERKVGQLFLTKNDVLLMQGEAVLGLEAAARGLVQPGTKVLNLVQGVFGKGMGYWLKDFGAELHELEVPYNDAVDPAEVERYLDEHPGSSSSRSSTRRPRRARSCDVSAIGPIAHAHGALTLDRLRLVARRDPARDRRVAPRRLRRRRAEMPGRAARHVADDGQRRGLGADPREPDRAARLLPLDARLEGAVDRRREVPVHAVGRRPARRRGGGRRAARGGARGVDRAARALGGGLPRRRPRDGPRALAAQRRDRRGVRDRDRGARRAHRRPGARALPRALRRDDLRRARAPGTSSGSGTWASRPARCTRSSGWPPSGRRSRTSARRSTSAPASRPRSPSCRRPSRRSRDVVAAERPRRATPTSRSSATPSAGCGTGVVLRADVYRPCGGGVAPGAADAAAVRQDDGRRELGLRAPGLVREPRATWSPSRTSRGRYASDGELHAVPATRASDGYDSVEWAARAARARTGRSGMYGFSYPGATQLLAAAAQPPSLAAIAPGFTSSQFYEGWTYYGRRLRARLDRRPGRRSSRSTRRGAGRRGRPRGAARRARRCARALLEAAAPRLPAAAATPRAVFLATGSSTRATTTTGARPRSTRTSRASPCPPCTPAAGTTSSTPARSRTSAASAPGAAEARDRALAALAVARDHGRQPREDVGANAVDDWHAALVRRRPEGTRRHGVFDDARPRLRAAARAGATSTAGRPGSTETTYLPALRRPRELRVRRRRACRSTPPGDEPADVYIYDPLMPSISHGGHSCCTETIAPMGPADQEPYEASKGVLVYTSEPLERDVVLLGDAGGRPVRIVDGGRHRLHRPALRRRPRRHARRNLKEGIVRARFRDSLAAPALLEPGEVYRSRSRLGPSGCGVAAGERISARRRRAPTSRSGTAT